MPRTNQVPSPTPFSLPILLLVEGRDTLECVQRLVRNLDLQDIDLRNFGGVNDLPALLNVLPKSSGFGNVVSIGIIRDAESGTARSAFDSVCGSLKAAGFQPPMEMNTKTTELPAISIFILPNCSDSGMLEDLCLAAVEQHPTMPCVDDFLLCLEGQGNSVRNRAKSRIYSFIASQSHPQSQLHTAIDKGYIDLDHPVFNLMKAFLQSL
ncbi:MAG: hypothetical protein DYG96_15120 [Chlorobi bacterium CHB2]|nr:hypothetical protein [Chlorobi bacterium CHB2]